MGAGHQLGADLAELVGHPAAEKGDTHREQGYARRVFTEDDPTGLSSPLGQLIMAGGLIGVIVYGLIWFRQNRKR
ncbi:hypothetical protein GCM10022247_30940 [Allokutzneria multivorans]|uniref:Uncharacterized protein n=1 Tax=Allokutzneria multivorans TaxID=1142134 RepID=A0ABP7S5F7_9PSEU